MSDAGAHTRATALAAALNEVQQWGVDRFSIEGVAQRSGLNTEYLREQWPTEGALIIEALREYTTRIISLPDTGSLHGDLTELALSLGAYLNESIGRRIARMSVVDSKSLVVDHDTRREFWTARRTLVDEIFRRAAARGELRDDVRPFVALQLLTSPLHTTALYTNSPIEPAFCRLIADLVTRALSVSR